MPRSEPSTASQLLADYEQLSLLDATDCGLVPNSIAHWYGPINYAFLATNNTPRPNRRAPDPWQARRLARFNPAA